MATEPTEHPAHLTRRSFMQAGGLAAGAALLAPSSPAAAAVTTRGARGTRARGLGIQFDGQPGPLNAITDVPGVAVQHVTLIEGEGPLVVGEGPVRTGLTAVLPRPDGLPIYAGRYDLNGVGELTGSHVIDEIGYVIGPIITTNTNSVGTVRDAAVAWAYRNLGPDLGFFFSEAVVGECHDGDLNDIAGRHVHDAHVDTALDALAAAGGRPAPVPEGNVGGGTGMICHQFKGGIGTSSRRLPADEGGYTVGVLVQANHGLRDTLTIAGVPVGKEITDLLPDIHASLGARAHARLDRTSSIIVVVGTDAPLLPHQLDRLARRAALGIGTTGGRGDDPSGDIGVAFSTAHVLDLSFPLTQQVETVTLLRTDPVLYAAVQATEEAIVNALIAARTMTGINRNRAYAIPQRRLQKVLRKYNRLND
jgi:L-aminopeptidase/D-esterase-like protein